MIFLFPENMILFFKRKIKDDLSQKKKKKKKKIHGNMIFSSNATKSWSFRKKSRWNMIFLVLSGKVVLFLQKIWYIFLDGKWKMIFLKKDIENDIFCIICINITNMILPFFKKNQRWSSTKKKNKKKTLKGDWHSRWHCRKSSNDFLYFYGDLHRRFYILLSSETKPGNLIYRIEIWLLLQFIWLKIFYNEESSVPCIIQPSGVVFRGVLQRQLRKVIVH